MTDMTTLEAMHILLEAASRRVLLSCEDLPQDLRSCVEGAGWDLVRGDQPDDGDPAWFLGWASVGGERAAVWVSAREDAVWLSVSAGPDLWSHHVADPAIRRMSSVEQWLGLRDRSR